MAAFACLPVTFGLLSGAPRVYAERAVISPTDNLVVEGLPPIPASIADDTRPYTESRSAGLLDWHPVRREILISTRFGNTAQIHRVATPGGARTQLTFFADPVGAAEYQPRGGAYFLFSRDNGGNEFSQIYRYDLANGRSTLLTDGARSQNGGWEWCRRGNWIVYGSTKRNGADRDLWLMDPSDPASNRILLEVSGGGWRASDWSPDDSRLVVQETLSASRSNLWLVTVASGEKTAITPPDQHVSYDHPKFSRDGNGLYLTYDADSEFSRLGYLELASRKITPLTASIEGDVEIFELSPDGSKVVFSVNDQGISRLHLLDTTSRSSQMLNGIPKGVVYSLRWHRDGTEFGFTMSSARSSADVYSFSVNSMQLSRWTESELGGLVASELVEPQLIGWPSFDGRQITGFLYQPPSHFTGKRPVLISIHGGPESQTRPGYIGGDNYFVNEHGVAVIYPNVRGSTGYGKTFERLDNGPKREESVQDIGALLDWIALQPELDASRIMVAGGSYGGYMSLAVAARYADRIRCALDVVGISHFTTFLKNTEGYRRDLRRVEYGDERDPSMAAFFDRISPLKNAHHISCPLFVVQGGNDPRVPLSEAEQIVAAVKANGTPMWYLMARDEGHGFRKKNNRDFLFYGLAMFVQKYLLGP